MGEVYRGLDTRLNRPVALKVSSEHFSDRFNTEARAISSLNHPHVCTLYDVGPNYLVMELLEGGSLAARLQNGPLAPAVAMQYGSQIAAALGAAHAKGIVHRDLKPGNVMLTSSGVKVVDFGLAKMADTAMLTATATGAVVGTLAYMSPEQRSGGIVDWRTDIYSLGLVLTEMSTGRLPMPGQDLGTMLAPVPERLTHIIERCLAHSPDDRWQTASDVRSELDWASRTPSTATTMPGKNLGARYGLMTAAALVLAIATAGVTSLFLGGAAPAPVGVTESRTSIQLPPGLRLDSSAPLALSPDGSLIAFTASNEDGVRALYLRPLGSTTATELKGTTGASHPFFSPDGRSIGYFASGALNRVAIDGGSPLRICPLPGADQGGAWGPNEAIVVSIRGRGLFHVKASGGTLEPVASDLQGAWPSFMPDGKVLYSAFGEAPLDGRTVGFSVVSLDGSGRRDVARLSDEAGDGAPVLGSSAEIQQAFMLPQGYVVYGQDPGFVRALQVDPTTLTPSGTARTLGDQVERGAGGGGVAFAAAANGLLVFAPTGTDHDLVWVSRQGAVTSLNVERGAYRGPSLSPDDGSIAVSANNETRRPELWVVDVERSTRSRIRPDGMDAEWSPDGRRIAFNFGGMWVTSPDGRDAEQVLSLEEARKLIRTGTAPYPTGWSPDGRYLLFQASVEDVWRIKFPEKVSEPVLSGPSFEWQGAISPDGRHLAFVTNESGRAEVYVASWPGLEGRAIVSNKGGLNPRWSRDSAELFYWQARTLMAARVDTSGKPGLPKPLFSGDFFGAARDASFDVARDGRFLMVKSDERAQLKEMTVLQNWIGRP